MAEVIGGFHGMIEPLKEVAKWKKTLVESEHNLGI